ncbi:MAG: ORF6N domain-containing protein [Candidatus Delongbacteria bacterium]|nr:ORF6N domain-containing protein [Candidatus Delongbacteria bacterium]MCG2761134.1 ORF6N domain-containing protein [Candidatus Delongbacteria bacterium]
MSKSELVKFEEGIRDRIYSVRGFQVMLDSDLAELYGVETKVLNQAVKRNIERFPSEFCFMLNNGEMRNIRSQFVTLYKANHQSRLQAVASIDARGKHRKFLPYVFTQEGVAMLSAVLKSEIAVKMSIKIMKAFIEMRKFIQANAQVFQRLDRVELNQIETDKKIDQVFEIMASKNSVPEQGIFFEGQIFDAYKFVSDLFRSAERSIVIVDNYVDDTVLVHLTKIKKSVQVRIVTKSISDQFKLDLKKFEEQYFTIEVKVSKDIHDRFIIIDGEIIYHFGASLKDLGKKLFGFTKMDKAGLKLLEKIK